MSIFINIFNQTLPIMLALCLMLLGTYYAQNYAGIIGRSLVLTQVWLKSIKKWVSYFTKK